MQEAFELVRSFDPAYAGMIFAAQLGIVRHAQGRLPELESALRAGVERFPMVVAYRCGLAALLADADRRDESRALLAELAAGDFATLRADENYAFNLGMLVEAYARLRDGPAPPALASRLEPYRGRHLTMQTSFSIGCASRHLGLLAALAGEPEHAATLLREAVRFEEAMGATLWLATSLSELAELLAGRGAREQREARPYLERATKLAAAGGFHGLDPQLARTRARLA